MSLSPCPAGLRIYPRSYTGITVGEQVDALEQCWQIAAIVTKDRHLEMTCTQLGYAKEEEKKSEEAGGCPAFIPAIMMTH